MNLDTNLVYKTYDPADVGFGVEHLPEQLRLAWHDARELVIGPEFKKANQIVVCGLGGSALGAELVFSAMADRLKVPTSIVRDYNLPAAVNNRAVVILTSFSGSTEEVLAAGKVAMARGAKVMVMCTGGQLTAWAKAENLPAYLFTAGELAPQPRYGLGFQFMGVLGLLERAGYLKIKEAEVTSLLSSMGEVIDSCAVDVKTKDNPAKTIAKALARKQVLIVASEHLTANAHALQNALNENGKQFAMAVTLPELNHHLLESFVHPKGMASDTVALMLCSSLYHDRTKKRYKVTADIFEEQGLAVIEYCTAGDTRLDEVGEVLQFGSYVAWYLGIENKINTTSLPVVEDFKQRLGK